MPEPLFPGVTIRHAREALQRAEQLDVGEASRTDLIYTLGWLESAMRSLLELHEVAEGE